MFILPPCLQFFVVIILTGLLNVLNSVAFNQETTFIFLPRLPFIILGQFSLLCLLGDNVNRSHSFSVNFKVLLSGFTLQYEIVPSTSHVIEAPSPPVTSRPHPLPTQCSEKTGALRAVAGL